MANTLNALIYPHAPTVVVERRMIDVAAIPEQKRGWWFPVVSVGKDDAFDGATQIKSGPVTTIEASRVVDTWTVRAKTQAELDAEATAAADAKTLQINDNVNAMVGKALFKIVNEIRTLQSQPVLTPAQFKTWFRAQQP